MNYVERIKYLLEKGNELMSDDKTPKDADSKDFAKRKQDEEIIRKQSNKAITYSLAGKKEKKKKRKKLNAGTEQKVLAFPGRAS
jgi:hypothetical protein